MYQLLSEKCEGLRPNIVDFARRLVATPSPSLEEEHAADLVEKEMRGLLFDHVSRDDAGNVIAINFGRKSAPTVLLNCHLDTASPSESELASEKADAPGSVRDGWLYGPGAADCKAGLAAQIYAAALLKHSLLPLNGNLVVAATVAEQNGLSIGIRHLLETSLPELGLHADYAILGEPTGLNLYHGHDGWMEFDVEVDGANPFRVEDVARQVFTHLDDAARNGRSTSRAETLSVYEPRFVTRGDGRTSVIRTACRMRGTDREDETLERVRQDVALVAAQSGDVAVNVLVRQERQQLYTGKTCVVRRLANAWGIEPFSPLLVRARQALAAAACPTKVGRWRLGRLGMGTAGSVLVREHNTPAVGYGPGEEDVAHTVGERVSLDRVGAATFGTAAIVHKMIGIPVYGWTSDEI